MTRSALSRRNAISSHKQLFIHSFSKNEISSDDATFTFEFLDLKNPAVSPYGKFMVSVETSGFPYGIQPDTKDLTSDSNSPTLITLRSTLMENSWFLSKPQDFHTEFKEITKI